MATPLKAPSIDQQYLEKAVSYEDYLRQVEALLAAGKVTGGDHPEVYQHFTRMNLQRMRRLDKTITLLPEVEEKILAIVSDQLWLVLTEGWCGDAAHSIPVMHAFAKLNPLITLKFLIRDENLGLMDLYLTNGVARSIPKLIALDATTSQELFNWGPRPAPLQEYFYRMKAEGMHFDSIKEELQRWYNTDKTVSVQMEISALVSGQPRP